jgi:hypothetical protein
VVSNCFGLKSIVEGRKGLCGRVCLFALFASVRVGVCVYLFYSVSYIGDGFEGVCW